MDTAAIIIIMIVNTFTALTIAKAITRIVKF